MSGKTPACGDDGPACQRAEEALRESHRFYQSTIDALSAHICVLNETGKIVAVNRAWRAFAAANPPVPGNVSEGANYFAICETVTGPDAAQAAAFVAGIRAVMRGEGAEFTLEYSCHSPDQRRWFIGRATRFAGEGPAYVVVAHEDITLRKRLAEALQDVATRRAALFEQTPIGLVVLDPSTRRILEFNAVAHQQLGYSPGEFAGMELTKIEAAESPAESEARVNRVLLQGQDEFDTQHRTKTGEIREVHVIVRKVQLAHGITLKCIWEDITERKQTEAALRASEEKYRNLFENMAEEVCFWQLVRGADGRIQTWRLMDANPPALKSWGRQSMAEIRGQTAEDIFGPGTTEHYRPVVEKIMAEGTPHAFEDYLPALKKYFRFTSVPFGECFITTGADITAIKQATTAFHESEARRTLALDAAQAGTWEWDLATGRNIWSDELWKLYGLEPHTCQPSYHAWRETVHPEDRERVEQELKQVLQNKAELNLEYRVNNSGPDTRWLLARGRPLRDDSGRVIRYLGVVMDITAHKRLDAERTEALARLTIIQEEERQRLSRELHDQTAQQLVALAVELKNLETNLAAGRPYHERLRSLRQTVNNLQQQVHQIAWDLRTGEQREGSLESALRDYVEEWSERAQIMMDWECRNLDGESLPATVETTVYRVAQEALANVHRHAGASRVSVLLERDQAVVRLTVEDDGHGFDAEAVQQSPEAARRLGLLGMKERVMLAGGTLVIESSPESGTTILVRLPIPTNAKSS